MSNAQHGPSSSNIKEENKQEGFSPIIAFCFTLNFIVGTGFLTIPWAFVQGGLVLSAVLLIAAGIMSDMAKDYLLETMARAEVMLDEQMDWIRENKTPQSRGEDAETTRIMDSRKNIQLYDKTMQPRKAMADDGRSQSLLENQSATLQQQQIAIDNATDKYIVKNRKFEVNTLCQIFLGKAGLQTYTLFISLYVYGLLWAYTSVFASALANAMPIFPVGHDDENSSFSSTDYTFFALLFGCIVVPLTCMELEEQVSIQVSLTICRFIMLFLIFFTYQDCAKGIKEGEESTKSPAALFRPSGIYKMLPIVIVANMFHHSVPGLSHPVADKRKLRRIFQSTTAFTTVTYCLLGVLLGAAFGSDIEQACNLNWAAYTGGIAKGGESVEYVNSPISLYIIVFPAVDVISAFPLNAIALANNLYAAFVGESASTTKENRRTRRYFRFLVSVPPIFLGIWIRELGAITDYIGTTGFMIGLSMPALLYHQSRKAAQERNYMTSTYYTSYASSEIAALFLFSFGVAMVVLVFISLVLFP